MRAYRYFALALLLIWLPVGNAAQRAPIAKLPPLEIKGLRINMTEAEANELYPNLFKCEDSRREASPVTRICKARFLGTNGNTGATSELGTIGGEPVNSVSLHLADAKVKEIFFVLNYNAKFSPFVGSADYALVRDAIVTKFGKPTTTSYTQYLNGERAHRKFETMDWRRGGLTLDLEENMLDQFMISISLYEDAIKKREGDLRKLRVEKRAKDL